MASKQENCKEKIEGDGAGYLRTPPGGRGLAGRAREIQGEGILIE